VREKLKRNRLDIELEHKSKVKCEWKRGRTPNMIISQISDKKEEFFLERKKKKVQRAQPYFMILICIYY